MCFKVQVGLILILEIKDIKHLIIVPQHLLEIRYHIAHEVLWPKDNEQWLLSILTIFIFPSEFFDICIEHEFNVVGSLEAFIEPVS